MEWVGRQPCLRADYRAAERQVPLPRELSPEMYAEAKQSMSLFVMRYLADCLWTTVMKGHSTPGLR